MSSIPRGVLRSMASGGGDRPKESWKPSETQDSAVRIYRYEKVVDVGGVTKIRKEVCYTRRLHFNGKGKQPDDCPGQLSCDRCRKASLTAAIGTDEALQQSRQMEATDCPTFVVVPMDEPTRFRTYDARFSAFQGIMLQFAVAGGYRSGKYPDPSAWGKDGQGEVGLFFEKCVEDGMNKVCGPNGRDIILSPKKKGTGIVWNVAMMPDGNQVLPFLEDSKVLNPEVVQARIRAAMQKKQSQKEGDE